MDPNLWKRISQVCSEALERAPEDRLAFVTAECEDNEELHAEVLSLLSQDGDQPGILDTPPNWDGVFAADASDETKYAGKLIGPFRIEKLIGRGGMGQIFLAERDDPEFSQRVALKVIRRGMDTDDILRRFRAERQILAGLDHPGIARLFDGGATDDGLPYFAMEYIDGLSITEFCVQNDYSVRQRLQLFKKVCAAGHYAHQNLIVHRDFKPGNILVSARGEPKLLDFGIAKVLDPDGESASIDATQASMRTMTPEYASPEQVLGGKITTASDIYSLGVLLYELLSGQLPHVGSRTDIERSIRESTPRKPSTALVGGQTTSAESDLTPRLARSAKLIRGDLDNIVLKAMRKEPERRYASLQEFADDIDRYLRNRPVFARKETLAYVARKFVSRNKLPVGLSFITAVALLVFSIVTATQSNRIAAQAIIVTEERDLAESVTEFMVDLFDQADPRAAGSRDVPATELLDRGYTRLATLDARPSVRARLMLSVARAYEGLDDLEPAENLLRDALVLAKGLPTPRDQILVQRELAMVLTRMGRLDEAADLHVDAIEKWRAYDQAEHPFVAMQIQRLGWIEEHRGENAKAEALYREAVEMLKLFPDERIDYAKTLQHLGHVMLVQYGPDRAADVIREAHQLLALELPEDDPDMGLSYEQVGRLEFSTGNLEAAESHFSKALELRMQYYGDGSINVALVRNEVARVQRRRGDLQAAIENFRSVASTLHSVLGPNHWYVVQAWCNLGNALRVQGESSEAEEMLSLALESARRLRAENHPDLVIVAHPLATLLLEEGRFGEAEMIALDAWRIAEIALEPPNSTRLDMLLLLAKILKAQGRSDEARGLLSGQLEFLEAESEPSVRILTFMEDEG